MAKLLVLLFLVCLIVKQGISTSKKVELSCSSGFFVTVDGLFVSTKGQAGHSGFPGLPGRKGEKGDPGTISYHNQNLKGDMGDEGRNGFPGLNGAKGEKGEPVTVNVPNADSIQVIKGDKGSKGDPGLFGLMGIPGEKGNIGFPGLKGDTGMSESVANNVLATKLKTLQRELRRLKNKVERLEQQ